MIKRQLLTYCCCLTLITASPSWAAPDSESIPLAQPDTSKAVIDKPASPLADKPAPPATPPEKQIQPPVSNFQDPVPPLKPQLTPNSPPIQTPPITTTQPPVARKLPPSITPKQQHSEPVQAAPTTPALSQPPQTAAGIDSHRLDIEIFDREDCLQCDKAREFLTRLKSLQPQLKIITRDVRKEPAALQLLKRMALNQGNSELDYPAFVVGGQLIIGFSEEAGTAQKILNALASSRPSSQQGENNLSLCSTGKEPGCALIQPPQSLKAQHTVLSVLGFNIELVQIGLPLFTIIMGMLDGMNHSSLWVLMLIISLLAPTKDRTLMFAIAGTFITVQGVIYFIMMAAWFNLTLQIDISRLTQILFAILAFISASIYIKKYLFFGQHIALSANEISKPGIYTRIRKITDSKTLLVAILSTVVLAVVVQISEFTFTSVFPALYTRVLHLQNLSILSNYSYILLYDIAYMLDDLIVLAVGLTTLNSLSLKKFDPRILMLVSVLVTILTGTYLMLVKP